MPTEVAYVLKDRPPSLGSESFGRWVDKPSPSLHFIRFQLAPKGLGRIFVGAAAGTLAFTLPVKPLDRIAIVLD